jgi:hypothetical protein
LSIEILLEVDVLHESFWIIFLDLALLDLSQLLWDVKHGLELRVEPDDFLHVKLVLLLNPNEVNNNLLLGFPISLLLSIRVDAIAPCNFLEVDVLTLLDVPTLPWSLLTTEILSTFIRTLRKGPVRRTALPVHFLLILLSILQHKRSSMFAWLDDPIPFLLQLLYVLLNSFTIHLLILYLIHWDGWVFKPIHISLKANYDRSRV